MQRDRRYSVYTSPGWSATERLPLVVLLHRVGNAPGTPDESGVGEVLEARIGNGEVPRVVATVPQGDSG